YQLFGFPNVDLQTITLFIKTPNQAYGDHSVEGVSLGWTVKELKTHLSSVYPSRPAVSDQRLIYSGKLLPDHLHLKDIFKQIDVIPTLHLVCAVVNQPQRQLGARPKVRESDFYPYLLEPTTSTEQPRPSSSSIPSELRQRRQTSPPSTAAPGTASWPGAPQMTQPSFPNYSLYSPQQLLWLQHLVFFLLKFTHAALAAASSNSSAPAPTIGQYPPVPAHQVPVPAPLPNQNPIDNLPVNQNPVQDGAFINPGEANQNMRMNAQGGPVMEDEEDLERDWLDWLYSAARFGVLLMIVYFNSSLSRFLLVMSTLLLMYLHTAGFFPFRRRAHNHVPNHLQPPEVQQREEPTADAPGPMTAVLVPPHRVSVVWMAWVFFKTLFSSLIPEVPQEVAN
uniref:Ubiquitin-like domain-containing protein n=1 Tax=Mola mola TaxID=94237 RepID=A0A3Q3XHB3_MOLML